MRGIILTTSLALASLALAGCQPESGEIYWDGGTELLSASCPAHAPEGFAYVPVQQVRDVLQYRHEGERLSANLLPNVLYCAYISGDDDRPCYRFSGLNITPGRALQFCLESEKVVDFELEDAPADET